MQIDKYIEGNSYQAIQDVVLILIWFKYLPIQLKN